MNCEANRMELPAEGKLVRDRIPEIISDAGGHPHTLILDVQQRSAALERKLFEEAHELLNAEPAEKIEEMADVLEVLLAMAAEQGVPWERVEEAAAAKRSLRGGFAVGVWLVPGAITTRGLVAQYPEIVRTHLRPE